MLDMAVSTDPDTGKESRHFLCKWRALTYEDCTWEMEQDVDPKKIDMYMKFRETPAEDQRKVG